MVRFSACLLSLCPHCYCSRRTNDISCLFSYARSVSERKITVADDVQDTFSESSFHKDLSAYLREAAVDDEIGSEDIIAVRKLRESS